jgi:hypothetical protein
MSEALSILMRLAQFVRDLKVNPCLLVVTLALGAAWLEQKRVQRRTAAFNSDHQDHAAQFQRHAPR